MPKHNKDASPRQVKLFRPGHTKLGPVAYALIDAEDAKLVYQYSPWFINSSGYAYYTEGGGKKPKIYIYLHRLIAKEGMKLNISRVQVDHRDRNPLNNQRYNLRRATQAQNRVNRVLKGDRDEQTKLIGGVTKTLLPARIDEKGRLRIDTGFKVDGNAYRDKVDAAIAANEKLRKEKGEFAPQNII